MNEQSIERAMLIGGLIMTVLLYHGAVLLYHILMGQ